ncbi:F-box domain-containing protein [Mycena sanguinolenta]|uniref:F-box domain-containing protein n=1 Tax=Mycena sanguinolenta TaxID=230812 RepID=A0A8H6ZA26_9AGAR|nr:F-box domain-containing protein [Mycena sanguinolenta]
MDVPELLLQFFEPLPLGDLISATHVCQQWRALVPKIDSPTRLRLLGLAFRDFTSSHPIPLSVRISYVEKIETTYNVLIPEPYRTILTEWPSSQPPPGMHWPHSVRFHASRFCYCQRHRNEDPNECRCALEPDVLEAVVTMWDEVYRSVVEEGVIPGEDVHASGELFNTPLRLHTPEQNAQTVRFIRAQPVAGVEWVGSTKKWANFKVSALRLSRYHVHTEPHEEDEVTQVSDGIFMLILDGPSRGQIHAWSEETWYDGFEAEDFWEWNYTEWDVGSTNAFYELQV